MVLPWLVWLVALATAPRAWALVAALLPIGATWRHLRQHGAGALDDVCVPVWHVATDGDAPVWQARNLLARALPATLFETLDVAALRTGCAGQALIVEVPGTPTPCYLELRPLTNTPGRHGAGLIAGFDISARIAHEKRNQRLRHDTEEALSCGFHILYRIDCRRRGFDYVSPTGSDMLAARVETLTADGGLDLVHRHIPPNDLARIRSAVAARTNATDQQAHDLELEYRLRGADGRVRWLRDSMRIFRADDGTLTHITGAIMEVTDTRMAAERLRVTLHSIGDAVIATDATGRITLFNPQAAALSGWSEAEALGRSAAEVVVLHQSAHHTPVRCPVDRVLNQRDAIALPDTVSLRNRHGTLIPVAERAYPILADDGRAAGAVVVLRDERAARESLTRLHESEARYRTLVESSPVGIFHFDHDLRITFINNRLAEIVDASADELIGTDLLAIADQSMMPAIRAALAGQLGRYEGPYRTAYSALDIRIGIRTAPVRDAAGNVKGGVCIVEDNTAKYEAERKLRESETRYALAMRGTNEGLWDWNPLNKELFLSSRLMALLGDPAASIRTTSDAWLSRLHPEDRDAYYTRMVSHLKGETEYFEFEFRIADHDGDYRWFRSRGVAQRDDQGKAYRMVGSIGDITARMRAQLELNNELGFSRTLVDSLPVGLCVARRDGSLTLLNQFFGRLTGLPTRQPHTLSTHDLIAPEDHALVDQRIERAFSEGIAWTETRVPAADGTLVPVHFLARRVTLYDTEQLLCIATDISERKQAEIKMRDLNRELELRVEDRTAQLAAAVTELEAFSYSVSHDLRSPLRAIDGYARIIREDYHTTFTEDAHQLFERMLAAVSRMSELIDDLLELSRVSRRPLERAPVDLSSMAGNIIAELKQRHPGRAVAASIEPGIHVVADAKLLRIAVENLLGNAWKFTAKCTSPQLRFSRQQDGDETVFCVEDNGAGFDMRYSDKLFGAFQRLHTDRDFEGTGIGLATVARIIQRHGGRVWANSEIDQGACFFFTLGDGTS